MGSLAGRELLQILLLHRVARYLKHSYSSILVLPLRLRLNGGTAKPVSLREL
jgi:hypothetical protein